MPMRLLWILLLALVAGPALALGLGQIEVKSRHGEPLLADIRIVSSDPSELEQLQARLASPETFSRIGLEPPSGLVQDLQFAIALDAQGRPVIRVTTAVPVQQPLLTFLLEVDWGQGRLVREYSALVATPDTVAAPAQPPIQAPLQAPANTIVRAPAAGPVADAPPAAEPEAVAAETAAADDPPAAPAMPAPSPAVVQPAAIATAGQALAPVQAGQTLSEIASALGAQTGHGLEQTMIALLRANPEAFIRGNINLLRTGAVLRVPGEAEWNSTDARQASALVREQVGQWRELRKPVPQPVGAGDPARTEAAPATAAAANARRADARLEIVPPSSAGANQAGTRSGIAAGGEGNMLQQQELIQTRETLAARDAEVEELKARVADLEKLQQQQQQLLTMKDSELAAAQQRLADSNAQPAPTLAATQQAQPPTQAGAPLPWLWIGVGLLALALLAWWFASRRSVASNRASRSFLADAAPAPRPVAAAAAAAAVPEPEPESAPEPEPARATDPAAAMAASGWPTAPAAPAAPAPVPARDDAAPPWHAAGNGAAQAATIAPLNPAPAGQERIELARAYIDLGDVETARSLLQEVADTGDAASRGEAVRLLRELV